MKQIQIGVIAYKGENGAYDHAKPLYAECNSELVTAQINLLQGFYEQFITDLINFTEEEQKQNQNLKIKEN